MMNKKGFTLVELMVVIVIIGVLAAVAMPKFADAISKSRASEAPNIIGQIASAEAVYNAEQGAYLAIPTTTVDTDDAASQAFSSSLGVNALSKFFAYLVTDNGDIDTDFIATATGMTGALNTTVITLTDASVKGGDVLVGDGRAKYLPVWQ